MSGEAIPGIHRRAGAIRQKIEQLSNLVEESSEPGSCEEAPIRPTAIADIKERLFLWCGTVGIVQDSVSENPLDRQLADASELRDQICHQLDELGEALDDLLEMTRTTKETREELPLTKVSLEQTKDDILDLEAADDEHDRLGPPDADETKMILEVISECIQSQPETDAVSSSDEDQEADVSANLDFPITDPLTGVVLPSLADLSTDQKAFECPTCFTTQSFSRETSWRMGLSNHVRVYHGMFSESQVKALIDAGRNAQRTFKTSDCPFCDEWDGSPALPLEINRNSSPAASPNRPFSKCVVASEFKKHVATQQEQLAILALFQDEIQIKATSEAKATGSGMSLDVNKEHLRFLHSEFDVEKKSYLREVREDLRRRLYPPSYAPDDELGPNPAKAERLGAWKRPGWPTVNRIWDADFDSWARSTYTHTRMPRKQVSTETLLVHKLEWELDLDPKYILIKRWVPEKEQETLKKHT
ncbi:Reticulocyte-binding protein 2-like protein a 5 [Colletotrichum musicola]|uniref:Reticulocyte-binding protein 2-like protein a 5 n=1 Tax=Colletotrichum musicola TaxID=2175873 RepID=A0A8H6NYX1_9PEZI|nr:Reticulocyte-binding protein 2-like protein a 5 [Colletotrichum musicola]